jgi:threonine/homoserine/homoserine lactone efflux protein
MTDRQFLWGLSSGIMVLAIAGTFWLGYGFGPHLGDAGWLLPAMFTVVVYGTCAFIIWLGVRLRRRAGFKRSDLKHADEHQRAETHKMMVGFLYIGIAQALLIALAVPLCFLLKHEEFVAPSIALIVNLHFIPLGRLFHVQAYYVVGIMGSFISLVAFSAAFGEGRLMFLGGTMGALLWITAVYILWRADRIAAKAIREEWGIFWMHSNIRTRASKSRKSLRPPNA